MSVKVSLIQPDIAWESVENNLRSIDRLFDSAPASDLYVLPETFATGFASDPSESARQEESIVAWMRTLAQKFNCAISGTLIVERDTKFRNRHLFVTPTEITVYDKRHLFSIGGEGDRYCAGKERKVVEWRGVRWLLATCYDLRFPVWLRNRGDYDVMICAASWPAARAEVWDTLLRARAIENVAYSIGVNRIGSDPTTKYSGGSVVYDFRGRAMARAEATESVLSIEIDCAALNEFREKFPVERDADDFELITD